MKKIYIHGFLAGTLSAMASLIYFRIYQIALVTAFDKIVNLGSIIASSVFGCLLMATSYFLLLKFKKENFKGLVNIIISVLSFASIFGVLGLTLPLDIESPELFPGLVVPMHIFPALFFFAIEPIFRNKNLDLQ